MENLFRMKKWARLLRLALAVLTLIAVSACTEKKNVPEDQLADTAEGLNVGESVVGEDEEGNEIGNVDSLDAGADSVAEETEELEATETPMPEAAGLVIQADDEDYAPQLVGTQEWINSGPLNLEELKGQVVLIDFWTYTCVNCIRTLPFFKVWHSKYADDGLVIIGVHTPEFQFEHDVNNVRQAISDYGIGWPVVQDNNYATWKAYENRYWPAKYLIDKEGIIQYTHFGEGGYSETGEWIRTLLQDAGADLSLEEAANSVDQMLDPEFLKDRSAEITAELYGGYNRGCNLFSLLYSNSSVDDETFCQSQDMVAQYEDPGDHKKHKMYLQGEWILEEEALRHGSMTSDFEDYMLLRFAAKSVNVVLAREEEEPFEVLLTLDGEYLTDENRGEDVVINGEGCSILLVDQPRLYNVVQAPSYGDYELKLSSNSSDFGLFAFTFGVYEQGI